MWRPVALTALTVALPALGVETVRISMGTFEGSVEIAAEGLCSGPDADLADAGCEARQRGRARVAVEEGRLVLDGERSPAPSVRFRQRGDGEQAIHAASRAVRGDVVVSVSGGRLLVVNILPLEDYVTAVLGGEMPVWFPAEALKAQAVAARTYALHKKLAAYDARFHLGSSVLHQVYGGLSREDPRTRAAAEATVGLVLTFDLEPIEAYFHASCGGKTEAGLPALGRDLPYLKPVSCPCAALPASQWTLSLSQQELGAAGGVQGPASLAVVSRTATGRARHVRLGPQRTLDAVTLRKRLGYSRLKSLQFEVLPRPAGGVIQLRGQGYGHGAGMCQWGAKAHADQGWPYQRILDHYYPGVELQRLY